MGGNPGKFPHPVYQRHVLLPAYRDAQRYYYTHMLAANRAHVVMLARQAIITPENAAALLTSLAQVEQEGLEKLAYVPGVEDLFFAMEGRLIELAGADFGGNLQLARSRNDLGYALTRMALRPGLLALGEQLNNLRAAMLEFAGKHLDTVMPGYTHTQPAQPTTLAHYLAGALGSLERDAQRLQQAYRVNDQSPLGAAAFTGTGFAIDRELVARLLGFEGVIASTYDAIAASDNLTDTAGLLTSIAINLSRLTKDLLFFATRESGALFIDDSFIQISSIMPQKRNPVVLEHLRARLSRTLGLAQAIIIQCHNIPLGDTQDIEDELLPLLFGALDAGQECLELYTAVFATLQVRKEHLLQRAGENFTTVTELADTLVREAGLPFRTAHSVVAALVRQAIAHGVPPSKVTTAMLEEAARSVGCYPIGLKEEALRQAFDPQLFVQRRTTMGGAAAPATMQVIQNQTVQLEADRQWLAAQHQALRRAQDELAAAVATYR
jgi:argininosuccinate lyase